MFNKELLMMGNNGGGASVEPPEVLYFYKQQSSQSESLIFMEIPVADENIVFTEPVLGAFSFDFPSNNYQLTIMGQLDVLSDLDSLGILYNDIATPWGNAQKYPYLFATIFLKYFEASFTGEISTNLTSYIRDLAENFFKNLTRVYLGNTVNFTESNKIDIRTPIMNSYTYDSVSKIEGDVLNTLWQYSEKVRKGKI